MNIAGEKLIGVDWNMSREEIMTRPPTKKIGEWNKGRGKPVKG